MTSSDDSAPTVDVALKPGFGALRVALALHAIPLAAIPLLMQSGWLPLVLAAGVGASWLTVRRNAAFGFGVRALVRIVAHGDGRWTVEDAAARGYSAVRIGGGVWSRVMLLTFRLDDGRRRSRLLLGDEAGAEALRRLRVRLLTRREPDEVSAP